MITERSPFSSYAGVMESSTSARATPASGLEDKKVARWTGMARVSMGHDADF
jgi:hypothetical protein